MHPELFGGLRAYAVCLVTAVVVGAAVAGWAAYRARVPLRRFAVALLVLAAAALAGSKLHGLLQRGGALGTLQAELFAGYRYPGAVVAVALAAVLLGRVRWLALSPGKLADLITPSFGFAMAVVRVGCLLGGCCAGTVSHLPWAIRFPAGSHVWHAHLEAGLVTPAAPLSLPVHPLQLYFGALSLALGVFSLWLERRKRYEGEVFLAYVAAYGVGQFLLEFLRLRPLPGVQYLAGGLAVVAGAVVLVRVRRLEQCARSRRAGR